MCQELRRMPQVRNDCIVPRSWHGQGSGAQRSVVPELVLLYTRDLCTNPWNLGSRIGAIVSCEKKYCLGTTGSPCTRSLAVPGTGDGCNNITPDCLRRDGGIRHKPLLAGMCQGQIHGSNARNCVACKNREHLNDICNRWYAWMDDRWCICRKCASG